MNGSLLHKHHLKAESKTQDVAKIERRIATVDEMIRNEMISEARLHSVTQLTKQVNRPSEQELGRSVEEAQSGSGNHQLGNVAEWLDREKERAKRQQMESMPRPGLTVVTTPPVQSMAQMTILEVMPRDPIKDLVTARLIGVKPACVRFKARVEYPLSSNVCQAECTLREYTLTMTEHTATHPGYCVAPLPNTYTIDLRKVDQLFYGGTYSPAFRPAFSPLLWSKPGMH